MSDYEKSTDGKVVFVTRFHEAARGRELSDKTSGKQRGTSLDDLDFERDFFTPSQPPRLLGYGLITIAVIGGAGLVYWIYS